MHFKIFIINIDETTSNINIITQNALGVANKLN